MEKQYEIGNLITEQRKRKNLTQRELADTLGITDRSVSKWENGRSLPDEKNEIAKFIDSIGEKQNKPARGISCPAGFSIDLCPYLNGMGFTFYRLNSPS